MKIGSFKQDNDKRVSLSLDTIKKLTELGIGVILEDGYGEHLYKKEELSNAGATFGTSAKVAEAHIITQVHCPDANILKLLPPNTVLICLTDPFQSKERLQQLANQSITTLSMEFIPRSTRAQKMDALSSQASLAGYVAVMEASGQLNQILPMMMTPAGTLSPSKVFVIGAGVAGLQAIATAKRLGARVEAFDTRPVVEEQIQSLGAKFLKIDLGETGETKDGYATQLSEGQLEKQRQLMAKACEQADIVITTAQVFGKKAPLIITKNIINSMKKGSIIVDLAVDSGGNVEGVQPGQIIEQNGVMIMGKTHMAQNVAKHASEMYASNIYQFIAEFYDAEQQKLNLNLEDEIIQNTLTTHEGKIVQPRLIELFNLQQEVSS